jgi:capsular polysaccharide biosynthesis protein
MSQQALDFRSSVKAVRRHSKIFFPIVVLGLLIGVGYAVLRPPLLTSTTLVVLPNVANAQVAQSAAAGSTDNTMATQVVIASSTPVLSGALPHVSPAMSLQALDGRIQVTSLAGSIISVSANGATAEQAETTANAVAASYIAYVTAPSSPGGRMSARVLEPAASAAGGKLPEQIGIFGLIGLLGGALVGLIVSLAISTSDRRLVERDDIANSIGVPVLVSIPVGRPSDAGSWAKLLDEYQPGAVHAWRLTKLLRQLGPVGGDDSRRGCVSLTVLSLASDPRALALGPQLAAFAAASGISTTLVVGPQQDVNVTATLRTACTALESPEGSPEGHGKPLKFVASTDDHPDTSSLDTALAIVVAVVDGRSRVMPDTVPTTATVLGVSAGSATAEQLARTAMTAAASGHEVVGILVADPDPTDQTTGRVPRMMPPLRRQLPTRISDVPTEIKR